MRGKVAEGGIRSRCNFPAGVSSENIESDFTRSFTGALFYRPVLAVAEIVRSKDESAGG